MNVDDFDSRIVLQQFTKFRDIYVHAAGIEVVIVYPDCLQRIITFQDFICMCAKETQKFAFLSCQLRNLVADSQCLFLGVEQEVS